MNIEWNFYATSGYRIKTVILNKIKKSKIKTFSQEIQYFVCYIKSGGIYTSIPRIY